MSTLTPFPPLIPQSLSLLSNPYYTFAQTCTHVRIVITGGILGLSTTALKLTAIRAHKMCVRSPPFRQLPHHSPHFRPPASLAWLVVVAPALTCPPCALSLINIILMSTFLRAVHETTNSTFTPSPRHPLNAHRRHTRAPKNHPRLSPK